MQNNNLDILDSLLNKEITTIESDDILANLEKELENIHFTDVVSEKKELIEEKISDTNNTDLVDEIIKINNDRKHSGLISLFKKARFGQKVKFFSYYIFISTIVFFMLLGITNYSAYSKIIYSYVNPQYLKDSAKDILNTMDNSKIKVYADEVDDKNLQEKILKEVEESDKFSKQVSFSPKELIKSNSNISLDMDITPYENRIIIPKIGKNIPLVDVDSRRAGNEFSNLESIFMNELEKGVVRYPGTALPGEIGNAFIFGHSSNYPWIKGNYNDVFVLLDNLSFGDEIIIYYNQKKYIYTIKEKKVVKPGDIKILNREPGKKEVSLMTCWPIGTSINRLIVFGELNEITK